MKRGGLARFATPVPERIKALVRELGWWDAVLYVISRGTQLVSFGRASLIVYRFYAQPVFAEPLLPSHRGRQIQLRWITQEEATTLTWPRPQHVIDRRFERGVKCLGAFRNGEMIGFLWLTLGAYEEDEVRSLFIPSPQGEAVWDFDVYVAPAHRLSPVFLKLWETAFKWLEEHGYRYSFSRISAFNTASLRSQQRLGGSSIARGAFLRLGGVQVYLGGLRPFLHMSFRPGQMPSILVRKR